MKKLYFLFALLFVSSAVISQITVDNSVTPETAMQTLLGDNVTISNLQFTGFNEQIGTFACDECGLDFDEGVILASGNVNTALGPNQSGGNSIGGTFSPGSDVDLDLLNPTSAGDFNDIAVLEFDFIALGDSVWFDYVFASDEYPEYSGSGFNDTFGFFMSGPGISGPYSDDSENLAIVPNTDIGVTINNVNAGTAGTALPGDADCNNCEYYENNGTGQPGQPQYDDPNVVGYDGYTVGLRAIRGGLICGETYHLRIVIADAGDNAFDSAVILRAGSLSSNLVVQVELEIEATTAEGVMNEECGLSTLYFIRPEAIDTSLEFVVEVEYAGVAENGVDYTLLPDVITFDPGVDTITYVLDAFEDGLIEGPESVQFIMQNLAVCEGASVPSFFEFFITESSPLAVTGYDVEICDGASIEIAPIVEGGSGGFIYDWSTTETTSEITVSPSNLTTYTVTLSDTCLASVGTADINVDIAVYDPLEVTTNPVELDIDCNWFGQSITMSASGGDGSYSYEWLGEGGANIGYGTNIYIWDNGITELVAQVTDGCTFETQYSIPINNEVPILEVTVPEEINVCPGDFTIDAEVVGGTDPINYSWLETNSWTTVSTTESMTYNTSNDMQISFSVFDACNQNFFQTIQVNIEAPVPLEINAGEDMAAGCEDVVTLSGDVISGVAPYTHSWETIANENIGNNQATTYEVTQDQTLIYTVNDICGQEMTDTVLIDLVFIPLELEVPAFLTGDCLTQFDIEVQDNLDDDVDFTWNGPDGMSLNTDSSVTYQSLDSGTIEVNGDAGCGNTASAQTEIVVASPEIYLTMPQDTSICIDGTAYLVSSASGGSGELSYYWTEEEALENFIVVNPSQDSTYHLTVTDQCQNQVQDEVFVEVEYVNVTYTSVFVDDYVYQFIPSTDPECTDCSYYWSFSDGQDSFETEPTHQFNAAGYVGAFLEVTTPSGCLTEYSGLVNVPPVIYVPNSFTPDNDGINDAFGVIISGIDLFEMSIYNRWGERVYYSQDQNEKWVGNSEKGDYYVPPGVYTYVIEYRSLDSSAKIQKGSVTVIR